MALVNYTQVLPFAGELVTTTAKAALKSDGTQGLALLTVPGYQPASVARLVSAANTNNATVVKASAGYLFDVSGYNAAAGVRYLKLYNKATAPTVGTDTPVMTIALKPSDVFSVSIPSGLYFSTGIGYGLVTGSADADNTAVTAADIVGLNLVYQ